MTSRPTHCPSCAQAIRLLAFHCSVKLPAIAEGAVSALPRGPADMIEPIDNASVTGLSHGLKLSRVNPRRRATGSPRLDRSPVGDTRVSTARCPYCRRNVTEYRFVASDGSSIMTHHCAGHGDVIPVHHIGA